MTESGLPAGAAGILGAAVDLSMALLFMGLFAALIRLIRGPTLPDRVMAVDLVASLVVGISAVHAVDTGDAIYIRVGVVIALIGFVGTAAWAAFIRKGGE
jgi:multicomponent Na+:H+ antiporter subunit F